MRKPPNGPEFDRFTEAMRTIMGVSKSEVMRRDAEEKAARKGPKRGPKPKASVSRVPAASS